MKRFILLTVLFFTLVGCEDSIVADEKASKVEVSSEPSITSTNSLESEVFEVKGQVVIAGLCGANLNLPGQQTSNCSSSAAVEVVVLSKSGERVAEVQPDTKDAFVFMLPIGEYTILVPETFVTEKKELAINVIGDQSMTLNLQSKLLVR